MEFWRNERGTTSCPIHGDSASQTFHYSATPKLHHSNIDPFRRRKFADALFTSVGLSLLFLVVYGGCNWITAHRHEVSPFYFEWERAIPFVPWLILPYMSIDLFFVAAPFLCRTQAERRLFSKRVIAAILIAGTCFLLFPLRFGFDRPHSIGWSGALFDWFRGMDAPFNLVPSLHAALWVFLINLYARHLRGIAWTVAMGWFGLIGLSPVLVHQHHVIDIAGGFILAGYCFYFFRPSEREPTVSAAAASTNRHSNHAIRESCIAGTYNVRVGAHYIIGALICLAATIVLRPWSMVLLWPAVSLGIVATAYFGVGPKIFRKGVGKLPLSTKLVLGPCLLGQHLSLIYYRRQCRPWDEIFLGIWIGRQLNNREAGRAVREGVTAVLDLSAEFSETKPFRALNYKNIPVLDLTAPTSAQLNEMAEFITSNMERGIVYVHCKIGYSRSTAAIVAYLLVSGRANNAAEAFSIIRRARPSIIIRPEIVSALQQFEHSIVSRESFSSP